VRYARKLTEIAPENAVIFLIAIEYPDGEISGPPFSVSRSEVERLYGDAFTIEVLEARDGLGASGNLKRRGVTKLTETAYLLRRRS
jgi:thiopurine S-methyltransferase